MQLPDNIIEFKVMGEGLARIRFRSNEEALAHRAKVGCGGWILGPFLFPGTKWTPSKVMLSSEGVEGELQ